MLLAVALATILGQPVPELPVEPAPRWIQGGPLTLLGLRGKVVLIRFFTDANCPYCRATAPSLNAFHDEFGSRGLVVIGLYTPKPEPREVAPGEVRRVVADYGFSFPVAVDADWRALHRLWLDRAPGAAFTSASLVVDRRGIVRHVHEGGAYGKDASDPKARRDHDAMRRAIVACLDEAP